MFDHMNPCYLWSCQDLRICFVAKESSTKPVMLSTQIEELEGYLEQLKADLKVAQHKHQATVEEVHCSALNFFCSIVGYRAAC